MAMPQSASAGGLVEDSTPAVKSVSESLHIKVYSPFNTYYDDEADSISAENDTGPFDVLLGHRNFLTLLKPCEMIIRRAGNEDEKVAITRGLMHVHQNDVVVFLDV